MQLTIDIQQLLRKVNGKRVKIKLTDLKTNKTKERGQIRAINQNDIVKAVPDYQALPPPEPLRLTAWEVSGRLAL